MHAISANHRTREHDDVIVTSSSSSSTSVATAIHSHHLKPDRGRFRCLVCQTVKATSSSNKWRFPCLPFFGLTEHGGTDTDAIASNGPAEQQPVRVSSFGFDEEDYEHISECESDENAEAFIEPVHEPSEQSYDDMAPIPKRRRLSHKQQCPLYDKFRTPSSNVAINISAVVAHLGPIGNSWDKLPTTWQQDVTHLKVRLQGEFVKFGNVRIHFTHLLTLHHAEGHSLIYCPNCVGLSCGSHGKRLTRPCNSIGISKSLMHTKGRLYNGLWPTPCMQKQYDPLGHKRLSRRYNVLAFKKDMSGAFVHVSVQQLARPS